MKLISLNIECNRHTQTVLDFLKKEKADVVCIQELLEEDFEMYKKELSFSGVFQQWNYITSLSKGLFGYKQGIGIFAKNVISSDSVFYIGKKENILKSFDEYLSDEKFQENKVLVWAEIKNTNDEIFKFITTHFPLTKARRPYPYIEGDSTPDQLEACDLFLDKTSKLGDFVLCGDFNAPRGRETFNRLSKQYKDNIPQEYKTSIDQNLHRVKGLQLMVDGLFTTPSYNASNVKLVDGLSDHMAIVAEINKN